MANTYTLIASSNLTSTASSVTFSSIPNTYTDLLLKTSKRSTATLDTFVNTGYRFNGSSSSLYSTRMALGYGNSVYPSRYTTLNIGGQTYGRLDDAGMLGAYLTTTNTFSSSEMYIPNYTASSNKPWSLVYVTENNSTTEYVVTISAGLWRSTDAITSIVLASEINPFAIGSSFWLYGIKNS